MNEQVVKGLQAVLSELNNLLEVMEENDFEGSNSLPEPLNDIDNVEWLISELNNTLL